MKATEGEGCDGGASGHSGRLQARGGHAAGCWGAGCRPAHRPARASKHKGATSEEPASFLCQQE